MPRRKHNGQVTIGDALAASPIPPTDPSFWLSRALSAASARDVLGFTHAFIHAQQLLGAAEGRTQKGCHVVWSGFNAHFRSLFPGLDPTAETMKLSAQGQLHVCPCLDFFDNLWRGGAMLYLPGDAPVQRTSAGTLLASMMSAK